MSFFDIMTHQSYTYQKDSMYITKSDPLYKPKQNIKNHSPTMIISLILVFMGDWSLCHEDHSLISYQIQKASGKPKRFRLTWWSDPSTTMAIGWDQSRKKRGTGALLYDEREWWLKHHTLRYRVQAQVPIEGEGYWIQLTQLTPNTAYQFQIHGDDKQSPFMWFQTAPDHPERLSFIAGGDSRNHRKVRRRANKIVSRIAPMAVLFGGDFTSRDTKKQWRHWLNDWQLSIREDGRVTPLIPARGNHDSEDRLAQAWGRAFPHFYFALSFGGELLRIYTLNSERPAGGIQHHWLLNDLQEHSKATLKFAQYHKPMRPHVKGKSEGIDEYTHWAPLFSQYALDLAIECDSHVMKVTQPLIYDPEGEEGFMPTQKYGTTFIGEGGWGAPLRRVDDRKSWTQLSDRLNHLFYIQINPKGTYSIHPLEIAQDVEVTSSITLQPSSQPHKKMNLHKKINPFIKLMTSSENIKVKRTSNQLKMSPPLISQ